MTWKRLGEVRGQCEVRRESRRLSERGAGQHMEMDTGTCEQRRVGGAGAAGRVSGLSCLLVIQLG